MKEENGAREEFTALVQAHSRAMYRAARSVLDRDADAEDAVGEAVLLAWRAFPQLRRREAARTWLLKITVNCAHDLRRRARPTVSLEEAAAGPGTSGWWSRCTITTDSRWRRWPRCCPFPREL